MRLSNNLSLQEVTKSATAKRRGISNEPTIEHLENLKAIAENVFQPIREHFDMPIGVSSGYRSQQLNLLIGGSKTSQHCKGEAIDIDADIYGGVTNREIFEFVKDNLVFDQLIYEFGNDEEPDWVHISYVRQGKNRGQVLKAVRDKSKARYEIYRDL